LSAAWHERLGAAVAEAQGKTGADLVVVVEPASASYRDVELGLATAVALAAFLFLVYDPHFDLPHVWVLPTLAAIHAVARLLAARSDRAKRLFTTRARRARAVREAARVWFFREHVAASPERTGVLLYASRLEGMVELIPDTGFEGKVPHDRWHAIAHGARARGLDEGVVGAVSELGSLLATLVPPSGEPKPPHPPRVSA
jgi:uncharacterized membrane protein